MKKKIILSSALSILLCLCLIVGSTFALFTSTDTVDVSISSGKVAISAVVDATTLALYSKDVPQAPTFENGGTATLTAAGDSLELVNVTPGDRAEFDLIVTNSSNVTIQYRVKWYVDGELLGGLVATADDVPLVNETTEWSTWTVNMANTKTISVSVELPITAGNEYQEKAAAITFVVEAVQGNGTAEYDSTAYVSSAAGLQAAADGGYSTIVLNNDITLDDTLTFGGISLFSRSAAQATAAIVLDLNGHTITADLADAPVIANGGALTVKNGKIVNLSGDAIMNAGNLTLEGGEYVAANGNALYNAAGTLTANNVSAIGSLFADGGVLTVNGGDFSAGSDALLKTENDAQIVINSGDFTSDGNGHDAAAGITINGGSFDWDVSDKLADDLTIVDNGDGTVTILPRG